MTKQMVHRHYNAYYLKIRMVTGRDEVRCGRRRWCSAWGHIHTYAKEL